MEPAPDRKPRRPPRPALDTKPVAKVPRKRIARAGEEVRPESAPESAKTAEEVVKAPAKRVRKAALPAADGTKE
jgi:hypothetical protein